jgi:hypothetical protein
VAISFFLYSGTDMSDTTLTAPNGAPKISRISEAVIRIAGNSQDGIQAIGGFLAGWPDAASRRS